MLSLKRFRLLRSLLRPPRAPFRRDPLASILSVSLLGLSAFLQASFTSNPAVAPPSDTCPLSPEEEAIVIETLRSELVLKFTPFLDYAHDRDRWPLTKCSCTEVSILNGWHMIDRVLNRKQDCSVPHLETPVGSDLRRGTQDYHSAKVDS